MSFRVQAVEALAAMIKERLDLATTVEVLAAPPSKAAIYPACAVLIDRTEYAVNDDFIPVDEDNAPLVGSDATLDLPADWARFDSNTLIYRVGRYMMHGRIFVATRHPAQRAEFEEQVFALFFADDLVPGRIVIDIGSPKVMGRVLPWSWPVAVFLDDAASTWTSEFAFDERLWSWVKFDIDVDIFVPRLAPQITQLVLEVDADFTQPTQLLNATFPELGSEVTDLDDGADTQSVVVDETGAITLYNP